MEAEKQFKPIDTVSPTPSLVSRALIFDADVSRRLHNFFYPFVPSFFHLILELSADFRLFFPLALSIAFSPFCSPFLSLLSPLILGLIMDLLVVALAKVLFRRNRPPYNPSMSPAVELDQYSFPSGHSTRVFLVASLVFLSSSSICAALSQYQMWIAPEVDEYLAKLVTTLCFCWASATAFSRVLLGRHYSLDVVVGSILGIVEGFVAFRFLNFEEHLVKIVSYGWEFFAFS